MEERRRDLMAGPSADAAERLEYARWLAPGCAVAATCLGLALQISNGFLQSTALGLVAIAFALLVGAAVIPRPASYARFDARIVPLLGLAGLVFHLLYLYTALPGMYLRLDGGALETFHWGLGILAVVAGSFVLWGTAGWARPLQIGTLLAAHCALGVWMIHRSPDPAIDVYLFQKSAVAALRSGVNPYAMTFPDIYRDTLAAYGKGLSVDGRLQFGFPYFPLSLLLSMPGQVFGKDPRYAQLAAIELAAVLMALARPRGLGVIAAALYLTTPRIFFVLEQSWTEPFLVLGVSAVVFAACRRSRLVPWLFGAFIALKQYLVFALPAAVLLVGWPLDRRKLATFVAKAAILGAGVTLPFVIWNPAAFWNSVVTLQFHQPFRPDALSVLSWWVSRGHEPPPVLISFVVAAAASALALWRLPRTPAGFGAAIGMTFLAFFAFNKQAFCNYYFFVVGALYASVAAWRAPEAIE
jgi:hypothetical protein